MGRSTELGHCRDGDGVSGEKFGEVDAFEGLAEKAPRGAGGECF